MNMRHPLTTGDEPYLTIRTLSVDYATGALEPPHTHPWPQLLYAARGAVTVEVPGRYLALAPRQALWIPRGVTHQLRMSSRVALRTLYFRDDPIHGREGAFGLCVSPLLHECVIAACGEGHLD